MHPGMAGWVGPRRSRKGCAPRTTQRPEAVGYARSKPRRGANGLHRYTHTGVRALSRAQSGPLGPCGAEVDTLPMAWLRSPQKGSQRLGLGQVARQLPTTGRRSRTDRHRGHGLRYAGLRARTRTGPAPAGHGLPEADMITPSAVAPQGAGGTESAAEGAGTAPNGHAIAESDLPPMCRP